MCTRLTLHIIIEYRERGYVVIAKKYNCLSVRFRELSDVYFFNNVNRVITLCAIGCLFKFSRERLWGCIHDIRTLFVKKN